MMNDGRSTTSHLTCDTDRCRREYTRVSFSAGRHLDELRSWALKLQGRTNHNKAACALANKLARICYATLRDGEDYGAVEHLNKKLARTS